MINHSRRYVKFRERIGTKTILQITSIGLNGLSTIVFNDNDYDLNRFTREFNKKLSI